MNLNFDSTSIAIPEEQNFDAIPEGKYVIGITNTEEKMSKAGNRYLNLQLQVLDGPHKNRVLFDIINLYHPDSDVREIAERTLKNICDAVRVLKPTSSEQLHNIPLMAVVAVETDSQYGDQNRVKKYLPLSSQESPGSAAESSAKTINKILDLPAKGDPPPKSTEAVKDDIPF